MGDDFHVLDVASFATLVGSEAPSMSKRADHALPDL